MNNKFVAIILITLLFAVGFYALQQRRQEKEVQEIQEALEQKADEMKNWFDNLPEPGPNEKG